MYVRSDFKGSKQFFVVFHLDPGEKKNVYKNTRSITGIE